MKSNYIVKNGERETGEMSVFEAVEVLEKYKQESTEDHVFEIHSFCNNWAIKKNGKVNQMLVFPFKELAYKTKSDDFDNLLQVVEVREFMIWYRIHDDKDFKLFYTDTLNLSDAVDEAINFLNGVVFAINYDGETVSRYGINFIKNPEKRR